MPTSRHSALHAFGKCAEYAASGSRIVVRTTDGLSFLLRYQHLTLRPEATFLLSPWAPGRSSSLCAVFDPFCALCDRVARLSKSSRFLHISLAGGFETQVAPGEVL